jgi:hypothetical protein
MPLHVEAGHLEVDPDEAVVGARRSLGHGFTLPFTTTWRR